MDIPNSGLRAGSDDDCVRTPIDNSSTLPETRQSAKRLQKCGRMRTEKRMLVWSCFTARSSLTGAVDLCTLSLSPVSRAWSTRKLLEDIERRWLSAGILSPTDTAMMSPGTTSTAGIFLKWPSRMTFASSGEYSLRAWKKKSLFVSKAAYADGNTEKGAIRSEKRTSIAFSALVS
jgi:hypothetical protein